MSKKLLLIIVTGAIMTSLITKLFSMSNGPGIAPELKQREIEFTGSRLTFSMPENFSPEFPAEDLIERVDFQSSIIFDKSDKALLLRRWWDFTEKTFLSDKPIGTTMLSISVIRSKNEYLDRLGLIDVIHKDLEEQHKESNRTTQPDFQIAYPETYESFNETIFNQQRWLSYVVASMNASEATVSFVTPLSRFHYIEIAFTLMPSSKIDSREFEDKYSRDFIEKIMATTFLSYKDQTIQKELGVDVNALGLDDLVLKKPN